MYTIYGFHAVSSYLSSGVVERVIMADGRHDARIEQLQTLAKKHHVPCEGMPLSKLDQEVPNVSHQGVIGFCKKLPILMEKFLPELLEKLNKPAMLLLLDQVQDPHNLGACIRTAAAAGCHAVIVPKDNAVSLNATVLKVASGAVGKVPFVQVTNLARTMKQLQDAGIWLYGTAESGDETLYHQDLTGPVAWVMGGEGKGMRRLTQEHCDVLCQIPTSDMLSCLNVSVATGVCLFESRRQRLQALKGD